MRREIRISLPREIVETIENIVRRNDIYNSIDEFIEEAVCNEINKLFEWHISPVCFVPPLKKKAFIKALNYTQNQLEDIISIVRSVELEEELEKLSNELGEVAEKFVKLFSGSSPHSDMVGEEGDKRCRG